MVIAKEITMPGMKKKKKLNKKSTSSKSKRKPVKRTYGSRY